MKSKAGTSCSGLIEAIGNVHLDDRDGLLSQLSAIVDELTLELSVATAVRDALAGRTVHTLTISSPDVCCCPGEPPVSVTPGNGQAHARQPGRKPKVEDDPSRKTRIGGVAATEKTIAVAQAILKHGAMTKDEIAKAMRWRLNQVAITLGRSKRHFLVRDDGKVLVAPALAEQLEA